MSEYIEEIAKVERVSLGWEDHGIFTCYLHLHGGSWGQGAGGYSLDAPTHDARHKFLGRKGTAYGMRWIECAMRACGVRDWGEVKGRTILALRDPKNKEKLVGLKPLPTETGQTFIFADLKEE